MLEPNQEWDGNPEFELNVLEIRFWLCQGHRTQDKCEWYKYFLFRLPIIQRSTNQKFIAIFVKETKLIVAACTTHIKRLLKSINVQFVLPKILEVDN